MVGTWHEKDGDADIETKVSWAKGGNFLTRNFKVTIQGNESLQGWQIIGWDAAERKYSLLAFRQRRRVSGRDLDALGQRLADPANGGSSRWRNAIFGKHRTCGWVMISAPGS